MVAHVRPSVSETHPAAPCMLFVAWWLGWKGCGGWSLTTVFSIEVCNLCFRGEGAQGDVGDEANRFCLFVLSVSRVRFVTIP